MYSREKQKARKRLDARLSHQGISDKLAVPPKGWIRAIREALGMSSAHLGNRMGLKSQSIEDQQRSEIQGNIKLSSLRSIAAEMDCTLVYGFVPNTSLENIIETRARAIAKKELSRVRHYMALEDQQTENSIEEELQEYIDEFIAERDIWDKQ